MMKEITSACDVCVYKLCFDWVGLEVKRREEILSFIKFLDEMETKRNESRGKKFE